MGENAFRLLSRQAVDLKSPHASTCKTCDAHPASKSSVDVQSTSVVGHSPLRRSTHSFIHLGAVI